MSGNRYKRGEALLKQNRPDEYKNLMENFGDFAPEIADDVITHAYGTVWSRETPDQKTRAIATISALAAIGGAEPQLRSHIRGALQVGCTQEEIIGVLSHIQVYCGFPRAINALSVAKDVFCANAVDQSSHG